MKRILVAGGAGFIGSHLCRRLAGQGHLLTVIDNFSTGSAENIAALGDACEIMEFDITQNLADHYESLPAFDEIYNLACSASPSHYQRDPVHTLFTSVLGTYQMLELARQTGAKMLQASTSEIYGNPQVHPQPEDYVGHVNPIGPRACYDEGKRAGETLCFDYHRQHGARIKVARIFNTYGPNMAEGDGRVVTNFIYQARRGEPLTIYGDGRQTRSFCYIDDMVDGLIALMESADAVTGPVNLGNPEEFSIEELAEKIIGLTGAESSLAYKPLPQDDPQQRQPDITLAKKLLGWKPKVTLDKGLSKMIASVK